MSLRRSSNGDMTYKNVEVGWCYNCWSSKTLCPYSCTEGMVAQRYCQLSRCHLLSSCSLWMSLHGLVTSPFLLLWLLHQIAWILVHCCCWWWWWRFLLSLPWRQKMWRGKEHRREDGEESLKWGAIGPKNGTLLFVHTIVSQTIWQV